VANGIWHSGHCTLAVLVYTERWGTRHGWLPRLRSPHPPRHDLRD
jgi:hypothetical protein